MRVIKAILPFICVLFSTANLVEAKEWRGIVPLHSTRADVERILGSSVKGCKTLSCVYELSSEIVFILYASSAACGDIGSSGWKVPLDTVIEITVRFKTDRPLTEFKIDESKYEKKTDKHLPGLIYYTNREEGIKIEAGKTTVRSTSYFPSMKDNHLRCHDPTTRRPCYKTPN